MAKHLSLYPTNAAEVPEVVVATRGSSAAPDPTEATGACLLLHIAHRHVLSKPFWSFWIAAEVVCTCKFTPETPHRPEEIANSVLFPVRWGPSGGSS